MAAASAAAAPAMPAPRPASRVDGEPCAHGVPGLEHGAPGWPYPAPPATSPPATSPLRATSPLGAYVATSGPRRRRCPAPGQRAQGFPAGEPPAGLSAHPAADTRGRRLRTGGNALVVIAVVVVIGIVMDVRDGQVGTRRLYSGALSGPGPGRRSPLRCRPRGRPRRVMRRPGRPIRRGRESAGARRGPRKAPAAIRRGRVRRCRRGVLPQPGVSPRVDQVYLTAMRQRPAFSGSGRRRTLRSRAVHLRPVGPRPELHEHRHGGGDRGCARTWGT